MSVWSLLLACQGSYYNGPENIIGFDPMWQPDNHASFFTGADGWGLFEQKRSNESQKDIIKVAYGQLNVAEVRLTVAHGRKVGSSNVTVSGQSVSTKLLQDMDKIVLKFNEPVTIDAGTVLEITLSLI